MEYEPIAQFPRIRRRTSYADMLLALGLTADQQKKLQELQEEQERQENEEYLQSDMEQQNREIERYTNIAKTVMNSFKDMGLLDKANSGRKLVFIYCREQSCINMEHVYSFTKSNNSNSILFYVNTGGKENQLSWNFDTAEKRNEVFDSIVNKVQAIDTQK